MMPKSLSSGEVQNKMHHDIANTFSSIIYDITDTSLVTYSQLTFIRLLNLTDRHRYRPLWLWAGSPAIAGIKCAQCTLLVYGIIS